MNSTSQTALFSANYPGGNIIVEKKEDDRVWLSPDSRHMQEGQKWFYWSFQAHNRRPVTVVFSHRNYVSVRGPAMSTDGGVNWKWLGLDGVRENPISEQLIEYSFQIPVVPEGADVRYAFCPQYQQSDWERWLKRHESNPALKVSELCKSRNGRRVEILRIAEDETPSPRKKVWLMARNHSCESAASFVLEGILETALGDDDTGRQLRKNWEFVAIPFMDKDGVEEGDQGKLRHPHDHNRDYNETAIYPEVAAAMHFGKENRDSITAFLDLHCPMVHGPWDNRFYLVGSPSPAISAQQEGFMKAFGRVRTGSVNRHNEGVLSFGEAWNNGSNFAAGKCAAFWAGQTFPDAAITASFEVPYANAEGVEINPTTARALGNDLAAALLCFLTCETLPTGLGAPSKACRRPA